MLWTVVDEPEYAYELHVLPPGRMPFWRWRYELWHGATLLAAGWRTRPAQAERAVELAAARSAHVRAGLREPGPERVPRAGGLFRPGAFARVDCGAVSFRLVPHVSERVRDRSESDR